MTETTLYSRRQFMAGAAGALALAAAPRTLSAAGKVAGSLNELQDIMPRTAAVLAGVDRPVQFYVSLAGKPIADIALGTSPVGGYPMRTDSIVSWASAVKPCTVTCVMQLWEEGKLDVDDYVTQFIPEFGVNGKEKVRIRHLITHTAHLGGYLGPGALPDTWGEMVNPIIKSPREPYRGWDDKIVPKPGLRSGYNPGAIWVAAEICRRIEGKPFEEIIRERVFEPSGMMDSWCGMPVTEYRRYAREKRFASNYMNSEKEVVKSQPAGGGLGPTRELARFYEVILADRASANHRLLSHYTIEAMTTPKSGFGYMGFWGFGFNLAMPDGVPTPDMDDPRAARRYNRYGKHASPRTFGHAGASGMQAFADPDSGLAYGCTGRVAAEDAVYEDLKLT